MSIEEKLQGALKDVERWVKTHADVADTKANILIALARDDFATVDVLVKKALREIEHVHNLQGVIVEQPEVAYIAPAPGEPDDEVATAPAPEDLAHEQVIEPVAPEVDATVEVAPSAE